MAFSSLMAHLDLGASNEAVLQVTAGLAERFKASVIGVAGSQPMLIAYGDDYMSGDVVEQARAETEAEMNEVEARFRAALHGKAAQVEWCSRISFMAVADYLAEEARAADLLITGPELAVSRFDSSRRTYIGDFVMHAGRPVLIVPPTAEALDLASVVIGWKETRETRWAVVDALPLLREAGRVTVVEVAAEEDMAAACAHLADVVAWLGRHGITADSLAAPSASDDATRLDTIAQEKGAGLLVAGAYGHNRLREWVLGGVTRDLLLRPGRCSLVSH